MKISFFILASSLFENKYLILCENFPKIVIDYKLNIRLNNLQLGVIETATDITMHVVASKLFYQNFLALEEMFACYK